MMADHPNDQTLVEQAKNDPQAFAALYERYFDRVYAYAYRQTNDPVLAQDVTASTFEKALKHIRRYHWQGKSFCAWLYRIARNQAIAAHRKQRWLAPWESLRAQRKPQEARLENTIQRREQQDEIQNMLDQLSGQDREIILLRYAEELSNSEIAEVLGCSVNNVYVRLHRALGRLRERFEAQQDFEGACDYVTE
jgi:RNA polymerase sigma-70 factor (ECF subfamily)